MLSLRDAAPHVSMEAIKASGYKSLELYAPERMVPFLIDFKSEHKEKPRKADQNLTRQPVSIMPLSGDGYYDDLFERIMPEVGKLHETKPGFVVDDNISGFLWLGLFALVKQFADHLTFCLIMRSWRFSGPNQPKLNHSSHRPRR